MAAGVLVVPGAQPSRSRNGGSVIAELRWYANGTTTPATVYADSGLTTPLSFPVVSDDAGRFVLMWADTATLFTVNWSTTDGQSATWDDLSASLAADAAIAADAEAALAEMEALVAGYAGTVLYTFSTTTTDSDPGAGKIRFNNATISSVTELYIDNTDATGVSETTWLDSFDDANSGSNRGTLYVRSLIDSSKFALFYVNGAVTDGTGYRKVPVTYVSGATLPADLTNVSVAFATAGATGAAGADGDAATITAGTTTTLSPGNPATVTNVGTSSAAIFNFSIPQGLPGSGDVSSSGALTVGHFAIWQDDSPATLEDGGVVGSLANLSSINNGNWSGTQLAVGNGGTGTATAFTAGSVVFAGASGVYSQDNSNLFWDNTNNRLGVGTATPSVALQVVGQINDTAGNVRSVPLNAQTSAYVLVASDNGKTISITTGGVTANNSVFSGGEAVTIFNNSGSSQTITQGAGVTMYAAGTATTGNRTLAQRGLATIVWISASVCVITGAGLT